MNLIAWHGFLGSPDVWSQWEEKDFGVQNFFSFEMDEIGQINKPKVLMGYSLGGRRALYHLLNDPQQWAGAILISTHPGLQSADERKKRIANDKAWANRFENDDFEKVLADWKLQSVFKNSSFPFEPKEQKRFDYAKLLREFSLGLQEDFRQKIIKLPVPLLWVTGEEDSKFTSLAQEIVNIHPHSRHVSLSQAGHRAPWDQPHQFAKVVKEFIRLL